ncbi:hypothetical protein [Zooshikella ganghwensis]|uniref:Bacterial virulence protein VirB8 domain-containing protein n=1 Tax=Zooshikella ganghwensis TaxID=202772 RepID=A0A4P9VE41_9GAMM|nr:hypothetical protein [Zooshikella ganghwensis]RDH41328.1 hypothetical protein B9G39_29095 [Zooshikella ganghwensis]
MHRDNSHEANAGQVGLLVAKELKKIHNNWLYLIIAVSVALNFYGYFKITELSALAVANTEVAWVKMYPNGTWDIDFTLPDNPERFFQANIDKSINDYIKYRYGRNPYSINTDFPKATMFMSSAMLSWFYDDKKGFDAIKIANDTVAANKYVNVIVNRLQHYDAQGSDLVEGMIYRTRVHIRRVKTDVHHTPLGKPSFDVVELQWRLLSRQEIMRKTAGSRESAKDLLLVNPAGIEIIQAQLFHDFKEEVSAS